MESRCVLWDYFLFFLVSGICTHSYVYTSAANLTIIRLCWFADGSHFSTVAILYWSQTMCSILILSCLINLWQVFYIYELDTTEKFTTTNHVSLFFIMVVIILVKFDLFFYLFTYFFLVDYTYQQEDITCGRFMRIDLKRCIIYFCIIQRQFNEIKKILLITTWDFFKIIPIVQKVGRIAIFTVLQPDFRYYIIKENQTVTKNRLMLIDTSFRSWKASKTIFVYVRYFIIIFSVK